jgi:hypothetical protein
MQVYLDNTTEFRYLTAKGEGNRNNTQPIFQHLLNQQSRTPQSTGELPSSACTGGFAGSGTLAPQLNQEVR